MTGWRIGSLFTGYGGLELGILAALGGSVAWHCEIDPAARAALRQHWPAVPNHGDVTTVRWDTVEPIDVLVGGFPCQKVSAAGRREGLDPTADALSLFTPRAPWRGMVDAITALRPRAVVIENVRGLLSAPVSVLGGQRVGNAFGAVLGDLADCGYDARWCCLRAGDIGAPHRRERVFILARPAVGDANGSGGQGRAPAGLPGQARPAAGFAADTDRVGPQNQLDGQPGSATPWRSAVATDTGSETGALRTGSGPDRPTGLGWGRPDHHSVEVAEHRIGIDWGPYGDAVRRWELILGRPAPAPTQRGEQGGQVLSPAFVEWMMGLPAGWVSDLPIDRCAKLRLLGNGVVPQQAAVAARWLFAA